MSEKSDRFIVHKMPSEMTFKTEKDPNYVVVACDGFIFNLKADVTSLIFYVDTFTPKVSGDEVVPQSTSRSLKMEVRLPTNEALHSAEALLLAYEALMKDVKKRGYKGQALLGPSKRFYPERQRRR